MYQDFITGNILQKIYLLRKFRRYSQKNMAEKLGMNQSNYNRLEKGETELTIDKLIKISDVLDVPFKDICNEGLIIGDIVQISGKKNKAIVGDNNIMGSELEIEPETAANRIKLLEEKVKVLSQKLRTRDREIQEKERTIQILLKTVNSG